MEITGPDGTGRHQIRLSTWIMQFPAERARFAVCIRNDGYPAALERDRLYRLLPDEPAESHGMIRVVDESGEGYLYPREFFRPVEVAAEPGDGA